MDGTFSAEKISHSTENFPFGAERPEIFPFTANCLPSNINDKNSS